jgi:hypothetical protein
MQLNGTDRQHSRAAISQLFQRRDGVDVADLAWACGSS